MRRYKSPKRFIVLAFAAVLAVLALPLIKSAFLRCAPLLQTIGERLALFSAFADMPAQSLELLEARFNDELFYADEPDTSPLQNPNPATPAPSPPPQREGETSSGAPSPAPRPSASPSPSAAPDAKGEGDRAEKAVPPEIPAAYRGSMVEEDLSGFESSAYFKLHPGYLRNYTKLTTEEIEKITAQPPSLTIGNSEEPQVLIYHTHATEAFERYDNVFYDTRNNWRSTDNNMNMVAVGEALAASLTENGINVIHDTTQHDYPSYNGSYERSAETIAGYLKKYPSIQVLLDVHRDAIDRDGTLVRPVTTIDGKKAAQLMIIAGSDDGTMNMPNWRENLRFAAAIQRQAEADYPHLMRPIFFCYRKYNMDITTGSLLLEFGSHGNTLEECQYTAGLVGKSLAKALHSLQE